jgi:hypothetical protein
VRRLQGEIQDLEERKLDAENRGNSRDALELDSVIQDKKRYYQEYVRVRGNQIQQAAANLGSSNALASEILREIQYVAESNGFSLVLKRSDPNLLWWSYEVDITELVLSATDERELAQNGGWWWQRAKNRRRCSANMRNIKKSIKTPCFSFGWETSTRCSGPMRLRSADF